MPRLLSVRKKARVPATCCAKVGCGSRSNSSLMVRLSALIQPVGLPSAAVSIVRRDASSALFARSECFDAAGGQQHGAVEKLDVDRMAARHARDLGLRRAAPLGELLLDPAAGDDEPASFRRIVRRRAQPLQRLGNRARTDPVYLGRVGQPGADRVDVRVDQSRNDGAAAEIDRPRRGAGQRADIGRTSDRRDAPIAYRERLGRRGIEGDDLAVDEEPCRRTAPARRRREGPAGGRRAEARG